MTQESQPHQGLLLTGLGKSARHAVMSGAGGGPTVGGGGAGLSCHPGNRAGARQNRAQPPSALPAGAGRDRRLRRNVKTQVRMGILQGIPGQEGWEVLRDAPGGRDVMPVAAATLPR